MAGEKHAWHQVRSALRSELMGRRPLMLRETTMSGPTGSMLVWQFMWVDQQYTVNNYAGKLMQARAKLSFRADDGAAILLSRAVQRATGTGAQRPARLPQHPGRRD